MELVLVQVMMRARWMDWGGGEGRADWLGYDWDVQWPRGARREVEDRVEKIESRLQLITLDVGCDLGGE